MTFNVSLIVNGRKGNIVYLQRMSYRCTKFKAYRGYHAYEINIFPAETTDAVYMWTILIPNEVAATVQRNNNTMMHLIYHSPLFNLYSGMNTTKVYLSLRCICTTESPCSLYRMLRIYHTLVFLDKSWIIDKNDVYRHNCMLNNRWLTMGQQCQIYVNDTLPSMTNVLIYTISCLVTLEYE